MIKLTSQGETTLIYYLMVYTWLSIKKQQDKVGLSRFLSALAGDGDVTTLTVGLLDVTAQF